MNERSRPKAAPGSGGPVGSLPVAPDSSQLTLALADRHAGQAANLAAGTTVLRDDRGRVERAVSALARSGAAFCADTVHRLVLQDDPTEYNRNLVSSVLGTWARDGRIREDRSLDPVPSANRSRRASRNRWWIGGPNRHEGGDRG